MLQENIDTLFKCSICLFFTNSPDKYLKHNISSQHYKKCCIKDIKDARDARSFLKIEEFKKKQEAKHIIALKKQEDKNIMEKQSKIVINPDDFICKCCKINTKNKKDFNKHILTANHINLLNNPDYNNRQCDFCSENNIKYIATNRYLLHKHYIHHHELRWIEYDISNVHMSDKTRVYGFINDMIVRYLIKMNRCKKMKYDDVYPKYRSKFDKYSSDKVEFIKLYGIPENPDDLEDDLDECIPEITANVNQDILDTVDVLNKEIKILQEASSFGGTSTVSEIKNKSVEITKLLKKLT